MTDPTPEECTHVLSRVYAFHDHAISEAEAAEIRDHLLACEPCLDRYDVEQAMRLLIRRCCGAERAPETLRVRIRTQITTIWTSGN